MLSQLGDNRTQRGSYNADCETRQLGVGQVTLHSLQLLANINYSIWK